MTCCSSRSSVRPATALNKTVHPCRHLSISSSRVTVRAANSSSRCRQGFSPSRGQEVRKARGEVAREVPDDHRDGVPGVGARRAQLRFVDLRDRPFTKGLVALVLSFDRTDDVSHRGWDPHPTRSEAAVREAPPRPPRLAVCHGGHRIPLWKDVHRIGSSSCACYLAARSPRMPASMTRDQVNAGSLRTESPRWSRRPRRSSCPPYVVYVLRFAPHIRTGDVVRVFAQPLLSGRSIRMDVLTGHGFHHPPCFRDDTALEARVDHPPPATHSRRVRVRISEYSERD